MMEVELKKALKKMSGKEIVGLMKWTIDKLMEDNKAFMMTMLIAWMNFDFAEYRSVK